MCVICYWLQTRIKFVNYSCKWNWKKYSFKILKYIESVLVWANSTMVYCSMGRLSMEGCKYVTKL